MNRYAWAVHTFTNTAGEQYKSYYIQLINIHRHFLVHIAALRVSVVVYKNLHKFMDLEQAVEYYTQANTKFTFASKIMTVNIFDDDGEVLSCGFEKPLRLRFEVELVS